MVDDDPLETQRHVISAVPAQELAAVGFDDAEEIGRGGFGVVYRCTQTVLDRTVAVKVLTEDFDEEHRKRFLREQRAMGRLTGHPNIVGVLHAAVTESGRPFIAMQYHQSGSLDTRIRRHGPLRTEEVLQLGVKLAGALETAHALGIVHRDVKPANILFTDYGEPALTDFGIAHIAGGFETATGVVTCSPAFTAPEVLSGAPPGTASDIYGLGATLFCAITGHAAYERRSGEKLVAQFIRITTEPLPDLREQGIPPDIAAVIERAMADNPHERQPTAAALGDELRHIERSHGFVVDSMALPPGRRTEEQRDEGIRVAPLLASPAAPTPSSSGGNLPFELTSFVGRHRELTQARKLLMSSRLVTLTGIGGVGKTRLALEVAATAKKTFPDGAWLVELGELREETLLADVVVGTLGLSERSTKLPQQILVDFLAPRRSLLVLDNCEHLVDTVAKLAESLLHACPRLRILTTTREPLDVGGEVVLRVPPLTVPVPNHEPIAGRKSRSDAMTLFAERAAAVVAGFEVTTDNQVAVARICQRLDGLPLAIELAAARMRAMTPEQILQRLTDRFTLLTRGSRGAPPRHRTLRLCIDWSYELCTVQERVVWSRLSVFTGGFELDAAVEICSNGLGEEELLDVVTALVDKSILIRNEPSGAVRFRMPETVRSYGREKAEGRGDYPELRRRHRDWCEQLCLDAEAAWISPRQLEWIARLDREQPNLREALDFCLSTGGDDNTRAGLHVSTALHLFWTGHGTLSEGRRWLDRLLAQPFNGPARMRIEALYANSVLAAIQGDLQVATALVHEGAALAADLQTDLAVTTHTRFARGRMALFNGNLSSACANLEAALVEIRATPQLTMRVLAVALLGLAYELRGDRDQALTCYEEVLDVTESNGESVYRSYSLWTLGVAMWRRGDNRQARTHIEQGLRLARLVGDPVCAAACLETWAWVAESEGSCRRAAILIGAAENVGAVAGSSPSVFPDMSTFHQGCVERVRLSLGDDAFDEAERQGRMLSVEAAIDYALDAVELAHPASAAATESGLTKREREVAELVGQGLTNKTIAAKLFISIRTVQGHVEHILAKRGFTSRVQIAAWVAGQKNRP
ncbi:MAG: tetratricopeptide repeat protein [Rhodococcus sp. (in: high G+C Gram-positive bacteria)]|nr:MAG: tetratricopeptide repeat protein [Rhodococcus sp. (in: high G+C Gram-positive bacteria)]